MNRISLFKDLARTGFHTSITTTYSVDAAFYDGSLHHRLRSYGCDNNILMADANMLQRAIAQRLWACGPPATRERLVDGNEPLLGRAKNRAPFAPPIVRITVADGFLRE